MLGEVILRAYLICRSILIGLGAGLKIVGSRFSPDTRRLRAFVARNWLPHKWIDLEEDGEAEALLRGLGVPPAETPVVIWRGEQVLRNPSNAALARLIGLRSPTSHETVCRLVHEYLGSRGGSPGRSASRRRWCPTAAGRRCERRAPSCTSPRAGGRFDRGRLMAPPSRL